VDLAHGAGRKRPAVVAALLSQLGVEAVQGRGVEPGDGELAEHREDEAVHVTPVVVDGPRRDGPHALAPFEPAVQQLGDGPLAVASVLAGGRLGDQPGL
jgi:hypothetical protein